MALCHIDDVSKFGLTLDVAALFQAKLSGLIAIVVLKLCFFDQNTSFVEHENALNCVPHPDVFASDDCEAK